MIEAKNVFIRLAHEEGGLRKYAEQDHEGCDETHSIRLVLNEFELISIGIQRGVLDFELYRRWNRSGTKKYWIFAKPFVERLRERTQNDALYHEFQQLYDWMNSEKKHAPKRYWWWGKFF